MEHDKAIHFGVTAATKLQNLATNRSCLRHRGNHLTWAEKRCSARICLGQWLDLLVYCVDTRIECI